MLHHHNNDLRGLHREFDRRRNAANPIKFEYELKTAPTVEPVSSTEMQNFIKDVDPADVAELDRLTKAAREQVESLTGEALIFQTWTAYSDVLPDRVFELRFGRIDSVTTIKVFDEAGTPTVVPATDYFVAKISSQVGLKLDKTWPSLGQIQILQGFQVEFIAGIGAASSDIPENIKAAMKQLTTLYFEYREPISFGSLPSSIQFLLNDLVQSNRIRNI